MQRQPTPQKDSHMAGHFMYGDNALELFANDSSVLTNMSGLPFFNSDKQAMKGDKKAKKVRDKKVDKEAGLKSWDERVAGAQCNQRASLLSNLHNVP